MKADNSRKRLARSLLFFVGAGIFIFVSGLFILLTALEYLGGVKYDPSILYFYPFMAALGAVFGFERWWSHQMGPYNPFHDP